jgi:hypothetical protein
MRWSFACFTYLISVQGALAVELPQANTNPVVLSEARTRIGFEASLNSDCSSNNLTVRVIKPPSNGKLEIEEGMAFTYFAKENQRYKCNEKQSWGTLIYYTSNPGFKGSDQAEIQIFDETGVTRKTRYKISVK